MGDERTGAGSTCNHLQGGSLHLCVAGLVEHTAHRAQHGGTLQECLLHTFVHYEVNIALAVAQLRVVELIIGDTILVLHDGQRLQALGEQRQFLGMNRDLASLSAEHITLHTDEVADVQQSLEHHVVKVFVLARAQLVA